MTKTVTTQEIVMHSFLAVWPPTALGTASSALAGFAYTTGHPITSLLGTVAVALLAADVWGRSTDYHTTRTKLLRGGYLMPQIRKHQHSWCSRTAMYFAARSVHWAYADIVRAEYHAMGYRWYHIFPNGTFTRNSPFLNPKFWVTLWKGRD